MTIKFIPTSQQVKVDLSVEVNRIVSMLDMMLLKLNAVEKQLELITDEEIDHDDRGTIL